MQFRLPVEADETALKEYVKEHWNGGEQGISASMGLPRMEYADWLKMIRANAEEGTAEWGRSLVLVCLENDRIVGLLSVRYELPKALSDSMGDVGYGVRPSERRKGYATQMLSHALSVCRDHGMEKVILGCYKDNPASAAVIKKCGGILIAENENYEQGRVSQYYAIEVRKTLRLPETV